MKVTKGICILMLAGAAWAQAPSTPAGSKTSAKPATNAQPSAQTPAQPAAAKPGTTAPSTSKTPKPLPRMASPMTPKTPVKQQAPAKTSVPVAKKTKPAAKPKAAKATPAPAAPVKMASAAKPKGKRDPFISPIVGPSTGPDIACSTGKKCLVIDQIALKGIIKSQSGMIAVVENPARKAYFLRENDPVFNGTVVRITGDTVVFRENTVDKLGKTSTRDVVKRVVAPAV